MSQQSANEQGHLLANTEEAELLKQLNEEYEEKFPGLRYVVFVNGRPRTEIMDDMRRRIARGDIREEEKEAIKVCSALVLFWRTSADSTSLQQAMCDIAADRARKLLKSSQEAAESST